MSNFWGAVQIEAIEHKNVPQSCLERGFACAMNCSNAAPGKAKASSTIGYLRPSHAIASFGGDTEVA